eukprot:363516-Chlamydomonas_euryale.AAC.26
MHAACRHCAACGHGAACGQNAACGHSGGLLQGRRPCLETLKPNPRSWPTNLLRHAPGSASQGR